MHTKRVGHLAGELEKNGVSVVACFTTPYAETRRFIRGLCERFVEVHVSTPEEKTTKKGLLTDPYEDGVAAEVTVDLSDVSEDEAFVRVRGYLTENVYSEAA